MAEHILHGPPPFVPLADGTAGRYIYDALEKHTGDELYMTCAETGKSVTYKELFETTCRLAQSLISLGYPFNTIISVCSENSLYFMYPIIAALYAGLTTAPINPNYTSRELLHMLGITKPKIIFCSKYTLSKLQEIRNKLSHVERFIVLDETENKANIESLNTFIERGCNKDFNVKIFKPVDFDRDTHVALIMRSSGTTGLPKGVMLTDKNILVKFSHEREPLTALVVDVLHNSTVNVAPFCHSGGCLTGLSFITLGVHIVQIPQFNEEFYLKTIDKYKPQTSLIMGSVLTYIVKHQFINKYDLSCLKQISTAGSPVAKDTLLAVKDKLNIKNILQLYGLTEGTLFIFATPRGYNKIGSIGKILPFVSVKVIDVETNRSVGPNQVGEICIKGDVLMKGYFENAEATKNVIDDDGWLHSGDIGYYDEDQYFYIVDRIKELIKYKGFQVAPAELEAVLIEHPKIQEAAVIGRPDSDAGELPTAFIVVAPGETITDQEIHNFIEDKVMQQKRLRGGIYRIDAIPRNATGKILRRNLLDLLDTL
ncbi:hypothetical protein FQA39_LY13848 [Lamprigera yunnana]|nr:hypothetical protein FQA39_LY13848 [Lamprigera yunnana]